MDTRDLPTEAQVLSLERSDLLPGHQAGRDLLIDMLFGQAHLPVAVTGHFQHDKFVVFDWIAVDYDDESEHWWWGNGEPFGAEQTYSAAMDKAVRHLEQSYGL